MIIRVLGLLLASAITLHAQAQPFPSRPVRLVVGYPPGGSGDFLTRVMADEMSKDLGVSVVADNRPGGGQGRGADVGEAGARVGREGGVSGARA